MTGMSVIKREGATREFLMEAAVELFHSRGYQQARVSDIVARAGVAQGTFYLYFRSKEDVFRQMTTLFMERFSLIFREATDLFGGTTEEEAHGRIRTFVERLLVIYMENRLAAEVLFREGIGHGGLFKEIYEDVFVHFLRLIQGQIETSVQKGILGFNDSETAAIFLIGLFERSVFYFMLLERPIDVDSLAEKMTDFILHGLGPTYSRGV